MKNDPTIGHIRSTFTLPPDVVKALDTVWRAHVNGDGTLCRNKSNYIADLIRRDLQSKHAKPSKKRSA